MVVVEDALKAVEALAEIVERLAEQAARDGGVVAAAARDLRAGCEALRTGKRGAPEAQRIVNRQAVA